MTRLVEVFRSASKRPMEAIEVIIALCMFGAGLYFISPTYEVPIGSTVASAFASNDVGHALFGFAVYIIPSAPIVLGFFLDRFNTVVWRTRATFMMFLALLFTSLARVITYGVFPILWLPSLALAFVSAVCYLYVRVRHR